MFNKNHRTAILRVLLHNPDGLHITPIVEKTKISRSSVRICLAYLYGKGVVEVKNIGMSKVYSLASRIVGVSGHEKKCGKSTLSRAWIDRSRVSQDVESFTDFFKSIIDKRKKSEVALVIDEAYISHLRRCEKCGNLHDSLKDNGSYSDDGCYLCEKCSDDLSEEGAGC